MAQLVGGPAPELPSSLAEFTTLLGLALLAIILVQIVAAGRSIFVLRWWIANPSRRPRALFCPQIIRLGVPVLIKCAVGICLHRSRTERAQYPLRVTGAHGLWSADPAQPRSRCVLGNDHQTDPWNWVRRKSSRPSRQQAVSEPATDRIWVSDDPAVRDGRWTASARPVRGDDTPARSRTSGSGRAASARYGRSGSANAAGMGEPAQRYIPPLPSRCFSGGTWHWAGR